MDCLLGSIAGNIPIDIFENSDDISQGVVRLTLISIIKFEFLVMLEDGKNKLSQTSEELFAEAPLE